MKDKEFNDAVSIIMEKQILQMAKDVRETGKLPSEIMIAFQAYLKENGYEIVKKK